MLISCWPDNVQPLASSLLLFLVLPAAPPVQETSPPQASFFSRRAQRAQRGEHGSRFWVQLAARGGPSVKASPLVRVSVPAAVLRAEADLRQDRETLVDLLLDHISGPAQDLRSEGVAGPADAVRAACVPPRSAVQLLHPAPGLAVGRLQAAADRAASVEGHYRVNSESEF